MRRVVLAVGLVLCAGLRPHGAAARPFTVEDLLAQESFGEVSVDPAGRYAVIERRGAYDSAARFDAQHRNPLGASRLLISDLAGDPAGRPLMAQPKGFGYLAGPWAPDSAHLAVFRVADGGWELGVVTRRSGEVRWLGVTPASNATGRSVLWASAHDLLVLARPSGDPPWELRLGSQSARRLPPRWAAAAAGAAAYTLIGSGAYAQAAPTPAPAHLLRFDVRDGTQAALAKGAFLDMELAPGGRRLALLAAGARLQPAEGRPPQGAWGTGTEATQLAILDLETRQIVRPCGDCDVLDTLLSWSPSGRGLLVFARGPDAPWTEGTFRIFETESARFTTLNTQALVADLQHRPAAVETGWLGETPIVRARSRADEKGRADWWRLSAASPVNLTARLPGAPRATWIGADRLRVVADGRLWAVSTVGVVRKIGVSGVTPLPVRRSAVVSRLRYLGKAAPETLLLRGDRGRLRLEDGRDAGLTITRADTAFAYIAARRALLAARTSPRGEETLELRRPRRPPTVISRINAGLKDVDVPKLLPIHHLGPHGEHLTSWLYLPTGTPGAAAPPLIVRPYLGDVYDAPPAAKPPILNFAIDVRMLVGHGYAVLLPSLPLAMSDREPLAGIARRVLGVVDAAAAQAPDAFDPDRVALWGHSYGGYTTLGVIGQTDRFKAAIAMNAPSDLLSLYGVFQPSWRVSPEDGVWPSWPAGFAENAQGRMGVPPWRAPARYLRNSPVFAVEAIHTPVLLIHGDQDPIGLGQAEEMFSALWRLRKDAILITYWGEGHIVASPGNLRDLYTRAFAWLDRYLAPARPPGRPTSGA
ncbi:MAG: prolyl oligopeptidase family serine peptidase [Caulobacteraceae bacterium]|nr:prolyl oligopeptidase family serine peptidase [Caulobacteraceae bacterium]